MNQSNVGFFVDQVAKSNSENNGYFHKIHKIFLVFCFVLDIISVGETVHSSAIPQITTDLLEKKKTRRLTVLPGVPKMSLTLTFYFEAVTAVIPGFSRPVQFI